MTTFNIPTQKHEELALNALIPFETFLRPLPLPWKLSEIILHSTIIDPPYSHENHVVAHSLNAVDKESLYLLQCQTLGCVFKTRKMSTLRHHIEYESLFTIMGTASITNKMNLKNILIGSHKPWLCAINECNDKFKSFAKLKDHHNMHFGIKSMQCPTENCEYMTSSIRGLNLHIKQKHPPIRI